MFLGSAAAAVLAVACGGFLIAGAVGGEAQEADIGNAVQSDGAKRTLGSFLEAVRDGDCDRAYAFVKRPDQLPGQMKEDLYKQRVCSDAPAARAELTVASSRAGQATVRAETDRGSFRYAVEKVDDKWKIDPLASHGSER